MDQTTSHLFVGREALLDEIKCHLLKGQHVALYGDRGIGKTAAVERVVGEAVLLEIYERAFGPSHPYVADSLGHLEAIYFAQGRFAEAEPLLEPIQELLLPSGKRTLPGGFRIGTKQRGPVPGQ